MSGECADNQRLSFVEKTMEQHSIILQGDHSKYPPEPGVMDILKQISVTIGHPESGNEALRKSIITIQERDQKRVAFFGGARMIVASIIAVGAFFLGLWVQAHYH